MLFSWSHQATGPVQLDEDVHLWFDRMIRKTPHGPRAMSVWASCGPRTGISNILHILWEPYGAPAGPARVPYGILTDTWRNWNSPNLRKSHTGVVCGHAGSGRTPYDPRTGCLRSPNPYRVRKLITHALKLYGPRKGRQNAHGARTCPVSGRSIFVSKLSVNSAYGARECGVTISINSCILILE